MIKTFCQIRSIHRRNVIINGLTERFQNAAVVPELRMNEFYALLKEAVKL
jgi:hypothetical protein